MLDSIMNNKLCLQWNYYQIYDEINYQYLPKPLLTVESRDYNIIILQCHIIYNIYRLTYNHFVLSEFKINQWKLLVVPGYFTRSNSLIRFNNKIVLSKYYIIIL